MAIKISALNAGWILAAVYAVGVAGFMVPQTAGLFQKLIPFNILFTMVILLSYHKKWGKEFVISALLVAFCGFLIELIGVRTGLIFGHYEYGNTLLFKMWDTPLMMMVSWLITVYSTRQIAEMIAKDTLLVSAIAAGLMVLLDFFIEPFAIRHDMWRWNSYTVPVHNYIGWFVCGVLIQYLFIRAVKFPGNKLSLPVYLIQLAFFVSLYLAGK